MKHVEISIDFVSTEEGLEGLTLFFHRESAKRHFFSGNNDWVYETLKAVIVAIASLKEPCLVTLYLPVDIGMDHGVLLDRSRDWAYRDMGNTLLDVIEKSAHSVHMTSSKQSRERNQTLQLVRAEIIRYQNQGDRLAPSFYDSVMAQRLLGLARSMEGVPPIMS